MGKRALKIEIVSGKADEEPTVVEHTGVQTSRELRRQLRKRRGEGLWAYVRIDGERVEDRDLTQYVESGHVGGSGAAPKTRLFVPCSEADLEDWEQGSRLAGASSRADWVRDVLRREGAKLARIGASRKK